MWIFCDLAILRSAGFPANWIARLGPKDGEAGAPEHTLSASLKELRKATRDPRFLEAVWLNSRAMCGRLQETDGEREPSRITRLDRKRYAYLQRFCLKNDTVSFFGPVGYVFSNEGAPSWPTPVGKDPVRCHVVLSHWVCVLLAGAIEADAELAEDIPLRLNFSVPDHLPPDCANSPFLALRFLSNPSEARLTLRSIRSQALPLENGEIDLLINQLEANGLVCRSIGPHPICFDGLSAIRDALSAMPKSRAVTAWLEYLAGLLRDLEAIRHAPDLAAKMSASDRLENRLSTKIARTDWRRSEGEPDRFAFFEDCVLTESALLMSSNSFERIGAKLQPCLRLMGARAMVKRDCWRRCVLDLRKRAGQDVELSLTELVQILAQADGRMEPDFGSLRAFDARLTHLLEETAPDHDGCVTVDVERIAAFLSQWPAPPFAFASPDIFLIKRNNGGDENDVEQLVLGEAHGTATIWSNLLRFAPPDRIRALNRRLASWLSSLPMMPCELMLGRRKGRSFLLDLPCPAVELAHSAGPNATASLSPNEVRINLSEGGPYVCANAFAKPLEFVRSSWTGPLADILALEVESFPLGLGRAYTPRIAVGSVVVQRARWEIDKDCLLVPLSTGRGSLVPTARALRARHGFPRHVYVRTTGNAVSKKPFFVDFECEIAIDYLRHVLRNAVRVVIEEALPDPESHWFEVGGEKVSSELRLTAFFRLEGQRK